MEQLIDKPEPSIPTNPGSYDSFSQLHPELTDEQKLPQYSAELTDYSKRLAGFYGVTLDGLHAMEIPRPRREASV